MNEGWTCPVCRRGVAPTEKTCDHGGQTNMLPVPFTTETIPYSPATSVAGPDASGPVFIWNDGIQVSETH